MRVRVLDLTRLAPGPHGTMFFLDGPATGSKVYETADGKLLSVGAIEAATVSPLRERGVIP